MCKSDAKLHGHTQSATRSPNRCVSDAGSQSTTKVRRSSVVRSKQVRAVLSVQKWLVETDHKLVQLCSVPLHTIWTCLGAVP